MGLGKEQLKNALGIAATFSGGLIEYQNDGSMGKVLCGVWAVQTGWNAALLAREGFTGPEQIFEGKKGFAQAFSNAPDTSAVLRDLGSDFKIRETYFKMHACMRGLHAAVDAVLDLREQFEIVPEEIEKIEIYTTPFVGRLSNPEPKTLIGAQCSLEFALAAALTKGHLSREETLAEAMKDAGVFALAKKAELIMDPEIEAYVAKYPSHWAAVRVRISRSGKEPCEKWVPLPAGEAENPFGWQQLEEKFRRLLSGTPFESDEKRLYGAFREFETLTDRRPLYQTSEDRVS